MTKNLFFLFIIPILIGGCFSPRINHKNYEVKIGQTFEIYVNENSCCKNCWLNEFSIKSIKLVDKKSVDLIPNTDDGGTTHMAWVFEGVKAGMDTITIVNVTGGESCENQKLSIRDIQIFVKVNK